MNWQLYSNTAVTGIIHPSNVLIEDGDIAFCAALVTLTQGQVTIHVINFTNHPYTLKRGSHIVNFSVLTPEQKKYGKPVDQLTTLHLLQDIPENAAFCASSLIKCTKSKDFCRNYWFPHLRTQENLNFIPLFKNELSKNYKTSKS